MLILLSIKYFFNKIFIYFNRTGEFCETAGLGTVTSGKCKEGFYCVGGATSSTPTDGVTGNICPFVSFYLTTLLYLFVDITSIKCWYVV